MEDTTPVHGPVVIFGGRSEIGLELAARLAPGATVVLAARGADRLGEEASAVLDAGADGIIVPQVRTVEEVERAVADCRYPPQGRRGYGPRVPTNFGRSGGADYVAAANAGVFASVMIETREAVEAIDAILAVPGLDSVVLGPYDLSGSLGMLGQVEHPTVVAALEHVIARAKAAGKFVGSGMGPDADYAVRMARRGVQWVQAGGDYGYLISFMDGLTQRVRAQLGGAGAPAAKPSY